MPLYKELPQKRHPAGIPPGPRLTRADFLIGATISLLGHLLANAVFGHPLFAFDGSNVASAVFFGLISAGLYAAMKQRLRKKPTTHPSTPE